MNSQGRAGQGREDMDILLYSFIERTGMKQFKKKLGSEFWEFRRGKGGMNFCLGRGCLVKGISLRFAVYMVNGAEGSFGNGDLQDVCVGGTYCWGEPLCGLVEQSSSSNPS